MIIAFFVVHVCDVHINDRAHRMEKQGCKFPSCLKQKIYT